MKGFLLCSDVLDVAFQSIRAKHGDDCHVSVKDLERVLRACDCVDRVCEEADINAVAIDFDEEAMNVIIEIECEEFGFAERGALKELIDSSIRFRIGKGEEFPNNIRLSFEIKGFWDILVRVSNE